MGSIHTTPIELSYESTFLFLCPRQVWVEDMPALIARIFVNGFIMSSDLWSEKMFVDREESETSVETTTPSLVMMFPHSETISALSRISLFNPSASMLFSAEA